MILMPSDWINSVIIDLFERYPDKIALMMNPNYFKRKAFKFRYAIDNGAYKTFIESNFFRVLDECPKDNPPLFIVCPDVVGCHDRTIALWRYYFPILKKYNYPVAFVAQDGCTPAAIPSECDWIFIGGTNGWKSKNIEPYIGMRPVHVGRVNSIGFVKYCESIGVASIDGTGWMRDRDKKYYDFINYFNGEVQYGLWG